jgi:NADPH:quinone reductase-like Zn-dependent oxidoreductase
MRAAAVTRFGGPDVLSVITVPTPVPGPSEVLIAVHTAGVGSWDAEMREGWCPGKKPPMPLIPGSDGSGYIAAVGSRVRRFHIGDPVYAYSFANPKGGFYAQYAAVDVHSVAPIPEILNMRKAGAVATTGLTALQGIDRELGLKRGETIAITGASGGVGTMAVQFAKWRGARVLGIASGDDGAALVRKLGADMAIDGHHADVREAAQQFAPDGLDCVFACVGGETTERIAECIHRGGRLAYPHGVEPAPKKRSGIRVVAYDAQPGDREFAALNRAVIGSKLQIPIEAAFRLEEAAKAHERLAQGHVLGKIILKVR